MNVVILTGQIIGEPARETTRGGNDFLRFNLETRRPCQPTVRPEGFEVGMFEVQVYGMFAKPLFDKLAAGLFVLVSGRLASYAFTDKRGIVRHRAFINAEHVEAVPGEEFGAGVCPVVNGTGAADAT